MLRIMPRIPRISRTPKVAEIAGMSIKFFALLITIALFFSVCSPLSLTAAEPPIPAPDNRFYVLDQAGVLSQETKSAIVNTSAELAQKTKAQLVVVTVSSLGGYPLEEFSLAILRQWGIGDPKLNNGVLLLVVPEDRKSRIEVGYGLEGALPDGKTGRIQDEYMLPYFSDGDYDQGVMNGYLALAAETAKEYGAELNLTAPQPSVRSVQPEQIDPPFWIYAVGLVFLAFLFYLDRRYLNGSLWSMLLMMLIRGGRGGRGGGGFGGGGFRGGGGSGGGGGSSRGW